MKRTLKLNGSTLKIEGERVKLIQDDLAYPTDNLISRWAFEDTAGDPINGNNLSYASSYQPTKVYANGLIDRCLQGIGYGFQQSGTTPYMIHYNGSWSISMWWKQTPSSGRAYRYLHAFIDQSGSYNGYSLQLDNSTGTVLLDVNAGPGVSADSHDVTLNEWHHYVLTYGNSEEWKLYIDNVLIYELTQAFSLPSTTNHVLAFIMNIVDDNGAIGFLDNTYFYNKVLDTAEINKLYNYGYGN